MTYYDFKKMAADTVEDIVPYLPDDLELRGWYSKFGLKPISEAETYLRGLPTTGSISPEERDIEILRGNRYLSERKQYEDSYKEFSRFPLAFLSLMLDKESTHYVKNPIKRRAIEILRIKAQNEQASKGEAAKPPNLPAKGSSVTGNTSTGSAGSETTSGKNPREEDPGTKEPETWFDRNKDWIAGLGAGTAAGLTTWGATEMIPHLRRQRLLRGLISAAVGVGAGIGTGALVRKA